MHAAEEDAWRPARSGAARPKTRGVVLDLIRAARTISRVELAAASGLTPPTISEVVRDLMADGLVVEAGRGASTGGKPPTLLQLNPPARYSVGVQLERNTCVIVVVDLAGRQVARTSFRGTAQMPPEQALPFLAAQVNATTGHRGRRPRQGARGRPGQLRPAGPARRRAADPATDRRVVRLSGRAPAGRDPRHAGPARQRRRRGRDRRVLDGRGRPAQHLRLHLHGHRDRRRSRRGRRGVSRQLLEQRGDRPHLHRRQRRRVPVRQPRLPGELRRSVRRGPAGAGNARARRSAGARPGGHGLPHRVRAHRRRRERRQPARRGT